MSFSFSCRRTTPASSADVGERAHPAQHLVAVVCRVVPRSDEEREDPDVAAPRRVAATSAACRVRSRCGSKSSSTGILPMGEPMLETRRPWRPRDLLHRRRAGSSSRSRRLTPQALRSSRWVRPSAAATSHCSRSRRRSRRRIRTGSTSWCFLLVGYRPATGSWLMAYTSAMIRSDVVASRGLIQNGAGSPSRR